MCCEASERTATRVKTHRSEALMSRTRWAILAAAMNTEEKEYLRKPGMHHVIHIDILTQTVDPGNGIVSQAGDRFPL